MAEKIIFHIDVNSAFLSWEACRLLQEDPESVDIRTVPAVIGGNEETRHGIVLAKSTPAKKYNIQTAEPIASARRKCPDLVVVPPTYSYYVERSREFIALLKEYAPVVEQYSIDEAFCDMTGTTSLYGEPVAFANRLREKIYNDLGFTVNIGISSNKLLAKMASDFKKPNLVHTLFPDEIEKKMWPLPIGELFFVGKATQSKLASLGLHTIGDVAKSDKTLLVSLLKKHGEMIWNYANGKDVEMSVDHKTANKSYGNSITLQSDVTDADIAKTIILSLCETVGARIRNDNAFISVISVGIKDNEFSNQSRQITLSSPTNVTEVIYENACRLFDQMWDHSPIRLLNVSTSHASDDNFFQYSLFDQEKNERLGKLNNAIDSIRNKYGEDSIKRARFIDSDFKHMTGGINKEKRKN